MPYLKAMSVLPRPSGPRALWRDFRDFLRGENRWRVPIALVSVALPALVIMGFLHDDKLAVQKPEMWFVPSWPADRPDAVIIEQNRRDQLERNKLMAEKRASYRRLADRLGIE